MNKDFSKHFKKVLLMSKSEATRLHSPLVNEEHILLGLLADRSGLAIEALILMGIDLDRLKDEIEKHLFNTTSDNWDSVPNDISGATDTADDNEMHITLGAMRCLRLSQLEARMMRQKEIDCEHLILAMLKDPDGNISRMMEPMGINYSSFFHTVADLKELKPGEQNNDRASNLDQKASDSPFSRIDDENDNPDDEEEDDDSLFESTDYSRGDANTATRAKQKTESRTPALDKYGLDLTKAAREHKLDPVVGRETEIERIAQILSRRKKNNPILIGEPGVGKTAIVEGLAANIVEKRVSWLLTDKRVISLDLAGLVAGTKYRGQFEERMKAILAELHRNQDIILYIDEIHTLVGAGNAQGSMDAANMLKPALSRGEIQCIGSTTIEEYRKTIEKDGALERRFQKVMVEPTSPEDTLTILNNIKDRYEEHHNVTFSDEALKACVELTGRYVTDRNFPDKAIDALDEAGSRVHLMSSNQPETFSQLEQQIEEVKLRKDNAIIGQRFEEAAACRDEQRHYEQQLKEAKAQWLVQQKEHREVIGEDAIAECVSKMTGIPITKVAASETQKLLSLRTKLQSQIIGQDKAIEKVVKAIQRNRVGLKDPQKPIGTFLFLGPTGVGKTYLAKKLAEEMFDNSNSLIRVDMSEFMEKYSVSRLIGAAPGYVGYDEGGQLTERVRRHPYSVVLFDEIEKAHPDVFNLMLQIFDEGHLTDALGHRVSFKNTIIILTSNVGSRQLKDFGTGIGFATRDAAQENALAHGVIQKALNKTFAPEFLNRIDDIINFQQLEKSDVRRIVDLELSGTLGRLRKMGFSIDITDDVKDFLADRGYDKQFGARPLKRAVQNYIEDMLCEDILLHQDDGLRHILIDLQGEGADRKPFANFSEEVPTADAPSD